MVVGEPTSNAVYVGHKGCLRFRCVARGLSLTHPCRAICKAARAIGALERFSFNEPADRHMGRPTLVVSQMQGGMNINSVPDRAEFGVDVRTIPEQDLALLRDRFGTTVGSDLAIEPIVELPSVFTSPNDPWVRDHRTDEWCSTDRLHQAVEIYERIIDAWISPVLGRPLQRA